MRSFPGSFLIILDGEAISKPDENAGNGDGNGDGTGDFQRARAGMGGTVATFTLKDCVVESDGWMLGPLANEDDSDRLRNVLWVRKEEEGKESMLQKVEAQKNGEGYKLLFGGECFELQ